MKIGQKNTYLTFLFQKTPNPNFPAELQSHAELPDREAMRQPDLQQYHADLQNKFLDEWSFDKLQGWIIKG